MHVHTKPRGHIVAALALAILALPLSATLARPAVAQVTNNQSMLPSGCSPSSAATATTPRTSSDCYVAATLPNGTTVNGQTVAFNQIGSSTTATFICDALTAGLYGTGGTATSPTLAPGCYNLQILVTDLVGGSPAIVSAICGNVVAAVTGSMADCSGVTSPICPVGSAPAPSPGPTTPCVATAGAGYTAANTATVTTNPGATHAYRIDFHGYIPTTSAGNCPVGTLRTGVVLTFSSVFPPTSTSLPPTPACEFTLSVGQHYIEITNVALATQPPGKSCGGRVFPYPALRTAFGSPCAVTATATGTTILKTGVDCTQEPPATGVTAPPIPPWPVGSRYTCLNHTLAVTLPVRSVPLAYQITSGPGSFTILSGPIARIFSRLGRCAGVPGGHAHTAQPGTVLTVCPTGIGTVVISACLAPPLPNSQPAVCSNPIYARYKL